MVSPTKIFKYLPLNPIGLPDHVTHDGHFLMKLLFKFQGNWMKIEDFRNLAYVDLLASFDIKNNWWLVEFIDGI